MTALPSGAVTFLFTDIEGSTRRWQADQGAMPAIVLRHNELLRRCIEEQRGHVVKTEGDAFFAAFSSAHDALAVAVAGQRGLRDEDWGEQGELRVRMALHTGDVQAIDGDYLHLAVNRAARVLSAGHGGQILLSAATQELVRDQLPEGVTLRDLGEHQLKDLYRPERVYQVVAPDLADVTRDLITVRNRPNNLPLQPTPFIGREAELAAITARVREPSMRLLTLIGPGGTGKTRLGLQAAADLLDERKGDDFLFPDGVFFVALDALTDDALVPSAIAGALSIEEKPGVSLLDAIAAELARKRLVLVLDNCEHLPGAGGVVSQLLTACAGLTVLATSRSSLGLVAEREYPVPPLGTPDPKSLPALDRLTQYDAVKLFIERAHAIRPDFAVTNETAPAVAEICWRLDGLPLAIELAAARTRMFPSPETLLRRLESGLGELRRQAVDVPRRQQTLEAAIAWSYDLLSPELQRLFGRLAVFAGGFTLEAAEAICGGDGGLDVPFGIESLLAASLLRVVDESEPRYGLLETVRAYAAVRLAEGGEDESLRRAHAEYFRETARWPAPAERGPWLDRMEREHANLRAALSWLLATNAADQALELASDLSDFWETRGYVSEGRRWLGRALALAGHPRTAARDRALWRLGRLAEIQGDYAEASRLFEESLAIARELDDRSGIASSLNDMGSLATYQGDHAKARRMLEESVAIKSELGEQDGIANSLLALGALASYQGDYAEAKRLCEESLAIKRQLGDRRRVAILLATLGELARFTGDDGEARQLCEESMAISRELGDRRCAFTALINLGALAQDHGDFAQSRQLYEESLATARELGDRNGIAFTVHGLGTLAQKQGDHAEARRLYEESLSIVRESGNRWGIAFTLHGLGVLAREQGDQAEAKRLYDESLAIRRELGNRSGIAESVHQLGVLAQEQGNLADARRLYEEALDTFRELGERPNMAKTLRNLADLTRHEGDDTRAEELLAEAQRLEEAMSAQPAAEGQST